MLRFGKLMLIDSEEEKKKVLFGIKMAENGYEEGKRKLIWHEISPWILTVNWKIGCMEGSSFFIIAPQDLHHFFYH